VCRGLGLPQPGPDARIHPLFCARFSPPLALIWGKGNLIGNIQKVNRVQEKRDDLVVD
jgi:hypothetical protein